MAPTEILAEQHALSTRDLAGALRLRTALLTGSTPPGDRQTILAAASKGALDLLIGTHALIQETVAFSRLGLVVIDEQHRFGVHQRALLAAKGKRPDTLVMTATPIPRTLAMTVYGDLDVSVIDELPPGRTPVTTKVYGQDERAAVFDAIREELSAGRQVYVVYPLVDESEKLDLRDATTMHKKLVRSLPEYRVGLLHGRMKPGEKEAVMADFRAGRLHLLVSTTVVEVGVDVANATMIVVEHAERFGLSQLHQLRGRVGRGEHVSRCLLVADKDEAGDDARKRLAVMEETSDGFRIAETDLEIRGPGEFLGTRQSGMPELRIANLARDADLLAAARKKAAVFIESASQAAVKRVLGEAVNRFGEKVKA